MLDLQLPLRCRFYHVRTLVLQSIPFFPYSNTILARGQLDEDVRDTVQVNLVHGSWKREDSNRLRIEAAMQRYKNVRSTTAHMPEPYGTHHSKMIILFRHDDQAQ